MFLTIALLSIQTLFGPCTIEEPIVEEIVNSSPMQRLKEIDQHGMMSYLLHTPTFNRYDHSIGVYHLLKRYNAPLEEQIAGLLHDVSHTAFSHMAEIVFDHEDGEQSYQDSIHAWYLEKQGFPAYEAKGRALEQKLPDMCADRIEYNLHTAYAFGQLSSDEIEQILQDLHFEGHDWYFEDPAIACKFASISLYMTEHFWGNPAFYLTNYWAGLALKRALALNIVTFDEFHFSTDQHVLSKLLSCNDAAIHSLLTRCENPCAHFSIGTPQNHDLHFRPKFRGIDPLVLFQNKLVRLSTLDPAFHAAFHRVKSLTQSGYYLNLSN